MQRIARLHHKPAAVVLDGYDDLQRILRRTLPPSTAQLYARPRQLEGGVVEWLSELGGQPVPLLQLDTTHPKQAAEARRLLGEHLAAVQQLADSWHEPGANPAQTERLRSLLQGAARPPDEKNIYVLNGLPVITDWAGEPPPAPSTAMLSPVSVVHKRRGGFWWLLGLLLLLLALGALFYGWVWHKPQNPRQPPAPAEAPPALPAPPANAQAAVPITPEPEPEPEPELQPHQPEAVPAPPSPPAAPPPPPRPDPVAALRQRIADAGKDCEALQILQKTEPLLKSNRELRVQLDTQRLQHCKTQVIREAKYLCPTERAPELAPELAIVFDASGSMDISLLASAAEIKKAEMVERGLDVVGGLTGIRLPNLALRPVFREPKRITAARQATTTVVNQLAADVSAGLVLVDACPAARSVGFFAPGQRAQLLGQIERIVPNKGTPLADGVRRAATMLDGVNRESVMLVVSDGAESCGQDPCEMARELARRKPHLTINVVDILGTGAGNCLAAATGGKVYTASNLNELQLGVRRAAQDVLAPAHCRP